MVTMVPASATSTVPDTVCGVACTTPPGLVTVTTGGVVSRVAVKLLLALVLPAASVAVALSGLAPWARTTFAMLHAPVPFAVTVPTTVPLSERATVLLFTAVPVTVTLAISVKPSLELVPVSGLIPLITGAAGAVVSMVSARAAEAAETLPATSVWVAVRL